MIPVKLSRNAAEYVRREAEYLRTRNSTAARKFADDIRQARKLLQTFPDAGNHMHGLQIAGNRVLVSGDYLIEYSHNGTQVEVTSIRHGRTVQSTPRTDIEDGLDNELDEEPARSRPEI